MQNNLNLCNCRTPWPLFNLLFSNPYSHTHTRTHTHTHAGWGSTGVLWWIAVPSHPQLEIWEGILYWYYSAREKEIVFSLSLSVGDYVSTVEEGLSHYGASVTGETLQEPLPQHALWGQCHYWYDVLYCIYNSSIIILTLYDNTCCGTLLWEKAFTNPNFTVENIYFLANTIVGHAEWHHLLPNWKYLLL